MSKADNELIEAIAMPWICAEERPCEEATAVHWEEMITALAATFTAIREEARRAAFKDCITELCIDCAEGDEPTFDPQAKWCYHNTGTLEAVGCSASKLRIRTAALEAAEKGERDG